MRVDRIKAVRRAAHEWLRRFGVGGPEDIDLDELARCCGVLLLYVPFHGAQAQLVRFGRRAVIFVSTLAKRDAQRFSIAHELGHFLLGHRGYTFEDVVRGTPLPTSAHDDEIEANAFASEFLMPRDLLGDICGIPRVDLDLPHEISREYNVSVLASARRVTELARESCAAVFSVDRKVVWGSTSATCSPIEKGRPLAPTSVAYGFWETGRVLDRPQDIPAGAWFDTTADVQIVEHAICSGEYGTVLSMLWVPNHVASQLGMIRR
jgi:hypothetical protein